MSTDLHPSFLPEGSGLGKAPCTSCPVEPDTIFTLRRIFHIPGTNTTQYIVCQNISNQPNTNHLHRKCRPASYTEVTLTSSIPAPYTENAGFSKLSKLLLHIHTYTPPTHACTNVYVYIYIIIVCK